MRVAGVLAAFALIVSCGGGGAPTGTPGGTNNGGTNGGGGTGATTNQISVGDNFFDPSSTTLAAGATVTWTWTGSATHNVTFDNANVGNSGNKNSGDTFQKTFAAKGTYNYHCTIHGVGMSGSIIIQ